MQSPYDEYVQDELFCPYCNASGNDGIIMQFKDTNESGIWGYYRLACRTCNQHTRWTTTWDDAIDIFLQEGLECNHDKSK